MIKYIKSVLWRVVKRLSYIEDARCLKVKVGTVTSLLLAPVVSHYFSLLECPWCLQLKIIDLFNVCDFVDPWCFAVWQYRLFVLYSLSFSIRDKQATLHNTNFTTNLAARYCCIYYSQLLLVSAIYPDHPQGVTGLVDVYIVNGNLSQITGTL